MKIFVPIKHNSQRVKNKNFRIFNEIPLWKNLIEKLIDFEVYIDTDSDIILKEASNYNNVIAYNREASLLGHKTSVVDLIKFFVNKFNIENEIICQVHVTSPFLDIEHLKFAKNILTKGNSFDSILTVNKFQNRFWHYNNHDQLLPLNHNPELLEQTQDLNPLYEENSYFYMFHTEVLKNNNRIGNKPYLYEISFPYNIDIDNEDDFELAKSILGILNNEDN